MKLWIAAAGAVAVAMVAGWWFFGSAETDPAVQIEYVSLDRGDIVQIVSAVGSVRALNTVEVGSQLSGQVEELFNNRQYREAIEL
ncbi:MAG: hypothetical protein ACOC0Q_03905, partial [Wenzhouxiangella sp.]